MTGRTDLDEMLADIWCSPSRAGESAANDTPAYAFSAKAMGKWSRERLTLAGNGAGRITATFRFEGTICTSMGLPLLFDYRVELTRNDAGRYVLTNSGCEPAGEEASYQSMWGYLAEPDTFMRQMDSRQPYLGQPLDDVLKWH